MTDRDIDAATQARLDSMTTQEPRTGVQVEPLSELRARIIAERDRLPKARLDPGELLHVREDTGALLTEVQRGSLRGQGAMIGWVLNEIDQMLASKSGSETVPVVREGLEPIRREVIAAIIALPQPTLGIAGGVNRGAAVDAINAVFAARLNEDARHGK